MKELAPVLKAHKQLPGNFCSASAHEFIAKLHGKIGEKEFPLQNDPKSENAGFQFESFLNGFGFSGKNQDAPPQAALDTIGKETAQSRFPLVSIIVGLGTSSTYWHIVVAVPLKGQVALVDPAKQDFITHNSAETLKFLQAVSAAVPGRDKINFLTYAEQKAAPAANP